MSTMITRRQSASLSAPSSQSHTGWRDADMRSGKKALLSGVSFAIIVTLAAAFTFALGAQPAAARTKIKALHREADRNGSEPVAIVSASLAQRMFPDGHSLDHHVLWTDPVLKFAPGLNLQSRRIIGVVPDIDNTSLVPKPTMTVYHPFDQEQFLGGGHLLVNARSDPYALVKPITRIMRTLSSDQPVEHAQTLEDIRAEVLSPERLDVVVSGVFAGVALLIAVVGVAGVLAFSVSGRTREFGIRLAVGSSPRNLLLRVIAEGAAMAIGGLSLGIACGYWLAQLAGSVLGDLKMPGVLPIAGSALVLLLAAVTASAIPAARAARIDVIQALRTE